MAPVNTRIVRRSCALLNNYGNDFTYTEKMSCDSIFKAIIVWICIALFVLVASFSPTRSLLKKIVPQPGEGPSEIQRKKGLFKIAFIGETQPESSSEKPIKVKGQVNGYQDPGYAETSKMISETAICLAMMPQSDIRGGVLTPATSAGSTLIERLKAAGMTFDVWTCQGEC